MLAELLRLIVPSKSSKHTRSICHETSDDPDVLGVLRFVCVVGNLVPCLHIVVGQFLKVFSGLLEGGAVPVGDDVGCLVPSAGAKTDVGELEVPEDGPLLEGVAFGGGRHDCEW